MKTTYTIKNHLGYTIGSYKTKEAAEEALKRINSEGWNGTCHIEMKQK